MLANGLLKYLFATSSNWFSHVRDKQQFTDRRRPHIRLYVLVIINLHTKLCQANHIHLIAIWKSVSYELISNELLCPRQNTPLAKKLTRDVVIFSCKKNENTNILRSDQSPLFPDLASAKTIALRPLIPWSIVQAHRYCFFSPIRKHNIWPI